MIDQPRFPERCVREGLLLLAMLAALVAFLALAGCASPKPRTIHVEAFTIILESSDDIATLGRHEGYPINGRLEAVCYPLQRVIYVPYRDDGTVNAELLLHELRHLPEWDGDWHGGTK